VNVTVALALAATTLWMPGAPGVPSVGVTVAAAEAGPVPAELLAVTVQEYPTPLDKPATTSGLPAPDMVCADAPAEHSAK
jgi:hypothetical protein